MPVGRYEHGGGTRHDAGTKRAPQAAEGGDAPPSPLAAQEDARARDARLLPLRGRYRPWYVREHGLLRVRRED
ncbi:MAG TPA: hypothetical protein VMK65_02445 [Longimicrobiales bacterium]|nr:hypothetical protein [Longimicrobiales bacterium]